RHPAPLRRGQLAARPRDLHRGPAHRFLAARRLPAVPGEHMNAVEISGLTKNFGDVQALDGLELTVGHGQVAGFLGPNGAGPPTSSCSCSTSRPPASTR